MGQLKEQLFLQHLNRSLVEVRNRFRNRYTAKKSDRFMVKGVTYEIGSCRAEGDDFVFEISSKIPQELLPEKVKKERFFNEVLKLMKKGAKKPTGARMENIVSATHEEELKERDYVNLTYRYREGELYTGESVAKRLKYHQEKGIPVPLIPGIATPAGRVVMALVEESIDAAVSKCVNELIDANEKAVVALGGSFAKGAPRRAPIVAKPAAKPVPAPAAKKAAAPIKPAPKPAAKKPVPAKPAAKKPVAKPAAKKAAAPKKPVPKPTAKVAVKKAAPKGAAKKSAPAKPAKKVIKKK
ncbi:MAG: hypothetical protein HQK87_08645 [Nitrospinae bacterium]|nr:hypothetical protein [Nitrospinota bacterium]